MSRSQAVVTAQTGSASFFAGKNKIINGDFGIWQRGTSINVATNTHTYTADRWQAWSNQGGGGTVVTTSQQTFTAGQTDVPGNPTYFARNTGVGTGTYTSDMVQPIEDVRTFAGQTITVSFYAKASSSQNISVIVSQSFGSGGSANVDTTVTLSSPTLTTSWARYTGTVTLPSITGKTIGAGSYVWVRFRNSGTSNGTTWDLANVQVEAGSVATAFQTATGTLAGEFEAACRYYWRITKNDGIVGHMYKYLSGDGMGFIELPVPMRVTPTSMDILNVQFQQTNLTNNAIVGPTLNTGYSTNKIGAFTFGQTGLANGTQGYAALTSSAYIGFSAEL